MTNFYLHVRMKIVEVKESKFEKKWYNKKSESGEEMDKVKFTQEFNSLEELKKFFDNGGIE